MAICHNQEPEIMSDFFRAFNQIVEEIQRVILAYRQKKNDVMKRITQTLTWDIKMYMPDANEKDWVGYADRMTFAINTGQDMSVRKHLAH